MSKEFEWRTGRFCVFKNFAHLVFVTKYRRGVITNAMLERLEEIFSETMQQMDGELLEFGGEDDHQCCSFKAGDLKRLDNLVEYIVELTRLWDCRRPSVVFATTVWTPIFLISMT